MFIYLANNYHTMASVTYNDQEEMYELVDHGRLVSRHRTASTAREAGIKYGRKHNQAVSYRGPGMNSAKWIYSPDDGSPLKTSSGSGGRSSGGLFGGLF